MKFAIVLLLAVCAVAANAMYFEPEWEELDSLAIEPQNAVTDKIKAAIEKMLKKVMDSFDFINGKMKAVMRKMIEEAGDWVLKAKDKANIVKGEVLGKINEMKQKGGEIAACAKALEPEYRQVEKDLMADIKKCAGDVFVAAEEMKKDVSQGMEKFKEAFRNLRGIVTGCVDWNPIAAVKCLKEKAALIKNAHNEMMKVMGVAHQAVKDKSAEILRNGRQCSANALEKAKPRIAALNEKLAKCYKFDDEIFYY